MASASGSSKPSNAFEPADTPAAEIPSVVKRGEPAVLQIGNRSKRISAGGERSSGATRNEGSGAETFSENECPLSKGTIHEIRDSEKMIWWYPTEE